MEQLAAVEGGRRRGEAQGGGGMGLLLVHEAARQPGGGGEQQQHPEEDGQDAGALGRGGPQRPERQAHQHQARQGEEGDRRERVAAAQLGPPVLGEDRQRFAQEPGHPPLPPRDGRSRRAATPGSSRGDGLATTAGPTWRCSATSARASSTPSSSRFWNGSSRSSAAGRPRSAQAQRRRCRIPEERAPPRRSGGTPTRSRSGAASPVGSRRSLQ